MKRAEVAAIAAARCIGCARCLEACPVDAIAGARGFLHVVVTSWCIGCRLCLPPCPVDCIEMQPAPAPWTRRDARAAAARARLRKARLAAESVRGLDPVRRRAAVAAALARLRK